MAYSFQLNTTFQTLWFGVAPKQLAKLENKQFEFQITRYQIVLYDEIYVLPDQPTESEAAFSFPDFPIFSIINAFTETNINNQD